mmetsp:Transcript_85622/g.277322  ORF Transcript_85622/g.277322 Transcript_85622/m.277322 type:complete len:220 (+) Transcript_85622:361-1020(+)
MQSCLLPRLCRSAKPSGSPAVWKATQGGSSNLHCSSPVSASSARTSASYTGVFWKSHSVTRLMSATPRAAPASRATPPRRADLTAALAEGSRRELRQDQRHLMARSAIARTRPATAPNVLAMSVMATTGIPACWPMGMTTDSPAPSLSRPTAGKMFVGRGNVLLKITLPSLREYWVREPLQSSGHMKRRAHLNNGPCTVTPYTEPRGPSISVPSVQVSG